MPLAVIPSPSINSVDLGPVSIHFYALCILAGIFLAMWWASRRWRSRGGNADDLFDIAFVAVIAGIIGARLYHVVTTPDPYFGPDGSLVRILEIWRGGLGIWGAVAGGALGALVMCRRKHVPLADFADVLAPALLSAQALGRLGNWFNQELYGGPTDLPWGLRITCEQNGGVIPGCVPGVYHPTFLYEMVWSLLGVVVILALERRLRLGGGRTFWLYVIVYTTGRTWIEMMRTDEAEMILGLRLNVWTSGLLLVLAVIVFAVLSRRGGANLRAVGEGEAPALAADATGRAISWGTSQGPAPAHDSGADPGDR